MKKLIVLLAMLITGCSTIKDSYLMTKFDANEYQLITQIRIDSRYSINDCDNFFAAKNDAAVVAKETELFALYSEHLPHNGDSYKAAQALNEIAQGLIKRYTAGEKVSTQFCKLKFEGIEHSADLIQTVLGGRPR